MQLLRSSQICIFLFQNDQQKINHVSKSNSKFLGGRTSLGHWTSLLHLKPGVHAWFNVATGQEYMFQNWLPDSIPVGWVLRLFRKRAYGMGWALVPWLYTSQTVLENSLPLWLILWDLLNLLANLILISSTRHFSDSWRKTDPVN